MLRLWLGVILLASTTGVSRTRATAGQPTGERSHAGVVRAAAAWTPRELPQYEPLFPVSIDEQQAPAPEPMGLDELEQLALMHNPTLPLAAQRVQALQGKYVQVGLCPNPQVGYVGDEIGIVGTVGQQGLAVVQPVITGGKLELNRAIASREIVKARQHWEAQRQRVLVDVRTASYEVLAAQRTVQLNSQLVRLGEEGQQVADQLFQAKEVSRVDVLQATVEANTARMQLENSRNVRQAAWRKLTLVIGLPTMEMRPLEDLLDQDTPYLIWEDSVARLLTFSPELAAARAEADRARANLSRQCAGRVPDVEFEAGVRYATGANSTVATAIVAVPLQLFDRNQGNIRRAHAEVAAANQDVRRLELALQNRMADAFQVYVNGRQQVSSYRDQILPDAQDSLDLVRTGYRQGELSYLELLNAQRTFFRVNLAYVDALRDLWVNAARIEGMLLSGGLNAPGQ